jgi:hypothetical protein
MCLKIAATLLPLIMVACSRGSSVEHTNLATTERLEEISQNTSATAGAQESAAPSTPDELGQSMRAGSADRPRAH